MKTAQSQSKTANMLFTIELDKRGQQHGVRAFAVHPGAIQTDIFRYMTEEEHCEDCNIAEQIPDDAQAVPGVRSYAVDPHTAAALWQFSEKVTGIRWP